MIIMPLPTAAARTRTYKGKEQYLATTGMRPAYERLLRSMEAISAID